MLNDILWKGGAGSDYFYWLCDRVGYQDGMEDVLQFLFDHEFTWINRLDENRAIDGLNLREEFVEECDVRGDWDDDNPCSILEMLVALSCRVEDEIIGDPDICLFWRMIHHLGLDETGNVDLWRRILDDWLERRIDKDGTGGLFPLQDSIENQRRKDIWAQCMNWLNENVYGEY